MRKSNAERQRLKRKREALGLLRCAAWIPGEAFEVAIEAGVITDTGSEDEGQRGNLVALVFCAWAEKMSRRDAQPRRLLPPSAQDIWRPD
jgi:hypothetical protein